MNILIVKLSAIGDIVHTLPSLAALRKLYPHAHITWVIEEAASDLIEGHPDLDRVIISRRKHWIGEIKKGRISVFKEVGQFIRELRSRRYDLVIDFHGLLKSAVIVFLSSGKRKLGYDSMQEMSGLFLTEKIPEDMDKHAVGRYLDLVHYLRRKDSVPNGNIGRQGVNDAEACVEEPLKYPFAPFPENPPIFYSLPEKYIIIAPSAGKEANRWHPDRFGKLAAKLPFPSVVICSSSESHIGKEVEKNANGNAISLAGRTNLKELIAVIKKGSFFISNDTGPMHIAAALNIPVFAIFGPANPIRTGPYGSIHTIIKRDLSCSPCYRKRPCSDWKCMNEITVDMVYEAISKKIL